MVLRVHGWHLPRRDARHRAVGEDASVVKERHVLGRQTEAVEDAQRRLRRLRPALDAVHQALEEEDRAPGRDDDPPDPLQRTVWPKRPFACCASRSVEPELAICSLVYVVKPPTSLSTASWCVRTKPTKCWSDGDRLVHPPTSTSWVLRGSECGRLRRRYFLLS